MMGVVGASAEAAKKSRAEARRRGEAEGSDHGWPLVRLGDVCEVRAGADYKAVLDDNGQYPIYGTGGIMGRASQCRCPANSVIVGRKGTLDNPLLVNEPFWNIDTCFGLIPGERLDADYLWRFCQNFDFYSLCPSSGRPSTTSDAIRDISIPLPPLSVQREIVARLDASLSRAERMEKDFADLAAQADAEFKAALNEEFARVTSGTVHGWPLVRLGDVCEVSLGKMLDKAKNHGEPHPYLRNVNVRWGTFDLADMREMLAEPQDLPKYSAIAGDLVACEGGEPGRCAIWRGEPILLQKALHRIRPGKQVLAEYLCHMFALYAQNGDFSAKFSGTTIKHLTGEAIASVEFPLPSLSVQRAIVSRLDAARKRADGIAALARQAAEAAANLKKALLKEAFE